MASPRDSPERYGQDFNLTLLTTDPLLATEADRAGIQRIGIDIERAGKAERQAGQNSRISNHNWDDLAAIKQAIGNADIFVRLNPPHAGSAEEIETALDIGATILMLPYFHREAEAETFVKLVRGRAQTMLLMETPRAIVRVRQIAAIAGIDEIMIGLNDLRFQMQLSGFEFIASPLMDAVSAEVLAAGKRFSFGGLARHDDGTLPTDPDLLYAQYPRLNATGAWLSRSFFQGTPPGRTLSAGVSALRARLSYWAEASDEDLAAARASLMTR